MGNDVSAGSRRAVRALPSAKAEYMLSFPELSGGLNLYQLEYMLPANQSPEMKNLHWKDGALGCRPGQSWLTDEEKGRGYSAWEELFHGQLICHVGDGLFCCDPKEERAELRELCRGVPENRGSFFRYGACLYYKNRGGYFCVRREGESLVAGTVEAYTPVTLINADPRSHAGDLYQGENRLSANKCVWYNAVEAVKEYFLPVKNIDGVERVEVDGRELQEGTDFSVDRETGCVSFSTAPAVSEPFVANSVRITYRKEDPAAYESIMDCPYAAVYGGDQNVCVVLGGCAVQPNAYFWCGSHSVMDPGYFPVEQYNLAGDASEAITGFGKQQNMLVVLKTHSLGRADFGITSMEGERLLVEMPYTAINSRIGCDLPHSLQLVENNLVFANREQGVHVILDSSAAYENNVVALSRNVNGSSARPGLLAALGRAEEGSVCSFDDGKCYWLVADGEAFLWDYRLSGVKKPSWFYYTNIQAVAFMRETENSFHLNKQGKISRLEESFSDYGLGIEKIYQFPTRMMGSYDRRKNVRSVLFSVRSDTDSDTEIQYISDSESRYDTTPIISWAWRLSPRNLSYRCLSVPRFAHVVRRQPACKGVRHFAMRLENKKAGQDLSVIHAQIFYTLQGREN